MGSGAFLVEACRQLGEALLAAWQAHGSLPKVPDDETPELLAQRTVAQRCLYGVDRNRMAVDLAKLSLWLATLAKDHPFTFLDHNLKHGDSLVGLTFEQVREFHWKPPANRQRVFNQDLLVHRVRAAEKYRTLILETGDYTPHLYKEQQFHNADESLSTVRFAANLVVAAFFAADNDKKREAKRADLFNSYGEFLRTGNMTLRPTRDEATLREGEHPIEPFHWEIEFPEVFGRLTPGFDVIVGNPPFAGKNTIGDGNRAGYLDWLKALHAESHGNADLVAHFFRRAFDMLRPGGTFGLIATNTIAQGDTRSSGLRWICTHGGTIFAARHRYKWPGMAAVVVSVVHVMKAAPDDRLHPKQAVVELDGKPVERITAYLFHAGGHDDPAPLAANAGKSFQGSILLGSGFIFQEAPANELINSIDAMHYLSEKDPHNTSVIHPYIGVEDILDSPAPLPSRFVINFGSASEDQARNWPDLFRLVESKVKPERDKQADKGARERWWQFLRPRPELHSAIKLLPGVLLTPQTSKYR